MALSSIELCSSALIKLGAEPISSFEDGSAEARVAGSLYPIVRDGLLSAHPWSFATAQTELARLASEPVTDFSYAYQLPVDFLRALSAGDDGRGRGLVYRIVNRELHTNAASVVLTYVFRPGEGDFPAFFQSLLVSRLSAEFCLPLTENTTRSRQLSDLATDELRLAKLTDGQQDTPTRIDDFPLVEVRAAGVRGPGRCEP